MKTSSKVLMASFAILAILLMCNCGGGGGSSPSNSSPIGDVPELPDDPLYTECMSTIPVNFSDPHQPVITLKGNSVINHPLNAAYVDAGASASDPADGDISSNIQTFGLNAVDVNKSGDYLIRYRVTNSAKLPASEVVRIVRVNSGDFVAQTARDIGTTSAHMGYYEHLPTGYSENPNEKYPLIIFQHGWFSARFLNSKTQQAPLSILENGNFVKLIKAGGWDDTRPFIVLSFQKCVDPLTFGATAKRTKLFIDYAINTYKVDTSRIYMAGHSQGAGDTWDYVTNYPDQLAAIVPFAGYYGDQVGCTLKSTPAWAFNGEQDTMVDYHKVVETVNSVNNCSSTKVAKVTVISGLGHNGIQDPVLTLSGLGEGLTNYDTYNQSIYDWLLEHKTF